MIVGQDYPLNIISFFSENVLNLNLNMFMTFEWNWIEKPVIVHLSLVLFDCIWFLSCDLAILQSVADLIGEIAALEQEVIRKELHLLSLYRRTFDQYVSESCSFTSEVHNMRDRIRYISYMKSKCQYPYITATSSRWIKKPWKTLTRAHSV